MTTTNNKNRYYIGNSRRTKIVPSKEIRESKFL
jgi:hypothetical protein